MKCFPDTSFLCAIYRKQDNSKAAAAVFQSLRAPLPLSALLLYEFRQSTRLQIWLHAQNPREGFPETEGIQSMADLQSDLDNGVVAMFPVDWTTVHELAETLCAAHTKTDGHRAMDILHVATALHLGATEFLSFDEQQRKLALTEGMKVRP